MKKNLLFLFLFTLCTGSVFAALPEVKSHVNDYAGVLNASQIDALMSKLADHERQTSNQVAVLTMKTLDGASLEDVSMKICEKWKGGLKEKGNGVLLLIVTNDRKIRIEVGRGLEGALPDITCGHIINDMKPLLKSKDLKKIDWFGGISVGVNNIIAAIKGEYQGTGKIVGEKNKAEARKNVGILVILIVVLVIACFIGYLICQVPVVGRPSSAATDGAIMYFLTMWLVSPGWAIVAGITGAVVGFFAPEVFEIGGALCDGAGSMSSGGCGGGSSDGGGWGGGGGDFSGGGASGDF